MKELLRYTKINQVTSIMGDLNAKIGNIEVEGIVDKFGNGDCDSIGE